MKTTEPLNWTGPYRVKNTETGLYLLRPVDAWGRENPEWVHQDFAFRFSRTQAQDQRNILGWAPHRIPTISIDKAQ